MDIYYGEERIASVYYSFDFAVVILCKMYEALFPAVLLTGKLQTKN